MLFHVSTGLRASALLLIFFIASPCLVQSKENPAHLSEDQVALQVLNRLTFGPKPGDLERIKQMGVPAFLEEQLNPGKIPDKVCEADLKHCGPSTKPLSPCLWNIHSQALIS